jgi:hypothetical protein
VAEAALVRQCIAVGSDRLQTAADVADRLNEIKTGAGQP